MNTLTSFGIGLLAVVVIGLGGYLLERYPRKRVIWGWIGASVLIYGILIALMRLFPKPENWGWDVPWWADNIKYVIIADLIQLFFFIISIFTVLSGKKINNNTSTATNSDNKEI